MFEGVSGGFGFSLGGNGAVGFGSVDAGLVGAEVFFGFVLFFDDLHLKVSVLSGTTIEGGFGGDGVGEGLSG